MLVVAGFPFSLTSDLLYGDGLGYRVRRDIAGLFGGRKFGGFTVERGRRR